MSIVFFKRKHPYDFPCTPRYILGLTALELVQKIDLAVHPRCGRRTLGLGHLCNGGGRSSRRPTESGPRPRACLRHEKRNIGPGLRGRFVQPNKGPPSRCFLRLCHRVFHVFLLHVLGGILEKNWLGIQSEFLGRAGVCLWFGNI